MRLSSLFLAVTIAALVTPAVAQAEWTHYRDPQFGYALELPLGLFEPVDSPADGRIVYRTPDGGGELNIFGASNSQGLSPRGLREVLATADPVDVITYERAGRSWFVLSGYYTSEQARDETVFYAKVMLNADRTAFAGFEISYPRSEKALYDPIVEKLEDTLRAPQ
jgi:hypothetical protein